MSLLDDYRTQIDSIDAKLVPLFLERMAVTQKVGEYKKQNGLPVLDSGREQEVIAAKTALAHDPTEKADVARLYESIMAISRRQQRKLVKEEGDDPALERWQRALDARREPVAEIYRAVTGTPYTNNPEANWFLQKLYQLIYDMSRTAGSYQEALEGVIQEAWVNRSSAFQLLRALCGAGGLPSAEELRAKKAALDAQDGDPCDIPAEEPDQSGERERLAVSLSVKKYY